MVLDVVRARKTFVLERTQVVDAPLQSAWEFFGSARNLEAITPPWLRFRIVDAPDDLHAGALLRYRLRLFGWPLYWLTLIQSWTPPRGFVDVQLDGPYRVWEHTHRLAVVAGGTEIYDHVRYAMPGGAAANVVVSRWLGAIFDHRAARTADLLG
jgi:ligand-binding SRPBCC domain-containing protein